MDPRIRRHARRSVSEVIASAAFVLLLVGGSVVAADEDELADPLVGTTERAIDVAPLDVGPLVGARLSDAIEAWVLAEHGQRLPFTGGIEGDALADAIELHARVEHHR